MRVMISNGVMLRHYICSDVCMTCSWRMSYEDDNNVCTHYPAFSVCLPAELHEAAVELADVALSGSARREAHQESLCSLARRCVRLQQAEAAARVSMQQQGGVKQAESESAVLRQEMELGVVIDISCAYG